MYEETDKTALDRGFGACPHCSYSMGVHCHECLAVVLRGKAERDNWRMDHFSGLGCIALCPSCRSDT